MNTSSEEQKAMGMDATQVVIFDCDGVLFDSKEANIAFYNEILAQFNLPPMSQEEVEYVHVSTAEGALNYLLARRDSHVLEEILTHKPRVDYTPFIRLMRMEPHLKELLSSLPPQVKRAVSTNRATTITDVLRIHGLEDEFDLVISSLDVKNPKPHPESVLKILHHFSVSPAEALFIGDSVVDQESAQGARVPFVAYKNSALQADYYIDDLSAIKDIIT
jgi:phosphoglycolate phosphatase-like HAD superfamily hydrolase